MGDLLTAAKSERSRGGAPHLLPTLLKSLGPKNAKLLRRILAAPHEDTNWAELRRELLALGHNHSVSTLKRWGEDYKANPKKFA
jgi:hypothetical protein